MLGQNIRLCALKQFRSSSFLYRNSHSIPCSGLHSSRACRNTFTTARILLNRLEPIRPQSRRWKSTGASKKEETTTPFGDEPPLYDGKPRIWARWVYALLLLDVLFTGFSVDMVMNQWTERVEKPRPSLPSSSNPPVQEATAEYEFVLRPLWQRLGLSGFEIIVGIGAAALILASRDRTVWRIRVRRVPLSSLPMGKGGVRPPTQTSTGKKTANVLSLETASSGQARRFLLHDCTLAPGRDLTELYLQLPGVRGHYIIGMNGAKVLGVRAAELTEKNDLRELLEKRLEAQIAGVNSNVDSAQTPPRELLELRKVMARAWVASGGSLSVRRDNGWTDGPLAQGGR